MKPVKDIRVLVVDDSVMVREMICSILKSEPGIVVAGEAADGAEAVEMVAALKPDIVTMDIEMPVMGGLEAIERIIDAHPTPILVVTALTGVRTAFNAVSKGALDVIEKPDISPETIRNLINKIRLLSKVDVAAHQIAMGRRKGTRPAGGKVAPAGSSKAQIVAIAASTGGPQAIHTILSHLPAVFPVPIVITQHVASGFTQGMVDWLNSGTPIKVVAACSGMCIAPGFAYVNPAEQSMRITAQGMIILGDRAVHQIYNPSCNTLLDSVAGAYRERALGLILNGMGDDGVLGMQAIRKAGGATIAQDEESSVVFGMNRVAIERGYIDTVASLSDIPAVLMHKVDNRQG
jgi:two-component system chemotaxis response regulator CheB